LTSKAIFIVIIEFQFFFFFEMNFKSHKNIINSETAQEGKELIFSILKSCYVSIWILLISKGFVK